MKMLYVSVTDPSGHERLVKHARFPFRWGTQLQQKNGLRDPKIPENSILLDLQSNGNWLFRICNENCPESLHAQVGDLKLTAFEIPMSVPILIGDTELIFSEEEPRDQAFEFQGVDQSWYTESVSGQQLLSSLKRASESKLSIYLSGDTGTGKELLAKMVHLWSERAAGPFVPINCGALALSLAESELFGHVKGAFTGAVRDRPGAFLQAHNGTLFLDEVGDLPAEIQVKLLRFLESGEIRPVGSDRVFHTDIRIVCATHKPLAKLVQEGKFRQDLYYRLASIPMEIPNLRSRPEDIRALSVLFAKEHGKVLTHDALVRLQLNSWPGNVRELRHAVERASGLAGISEKVIHAKDFDFLIQQSVQDASEEAQQAGAEMVLSGVGTLKQMEKVLILRALKIAHGNRSNAAKILGIARSTLFEMMKRHRIMGPKNTAYWVERVG